MESEFSVNVRKSTSFKFKLISSVFLIGLLGLVFSFWPEWGYGGLGFSGEPPLWAQLGVTAIAILLWREACRRPKFEVSLFRTLRIARGLAAQGFIYGFVWAAFSFIPLAIALPGFVKKGNDEKSAEMWSITAFLTLCFSIAGFIYGALRRRKEVVEALSEKS